eukprot:4047144-Prymnesium_polylepis.1
MSGVDRRPEEWEEVGVNKISVRSYYTEPMHGARGACFARSRHACLGTSSPPAVRLPPLQCDKCSPPSYVPAGAVR